MLCLVHRGFNSSGMHPVHWRLHVGVTPSQPAHLDQTAVAELGLGQLCLLPLNSSAPFHFEAHQTSTSRQQQLIYGIFRKEAAASFEEMRPTAGRRHDCGTRPDSADDDSSQSIDVGVLASAAGGRRWEVGGQALELVKCPRLRTRCWTGVLRSEGTES